MAGSRARATKLDELKHQQILERNRAIERATVHIGPKVVTWGFGALIAYFSADAIKVAAKELAGKLTVTDISLTGKAGWLSSTPDWCYWAVSIAVIYGVIGIVYGIHQRQLRRSKTSELTRRISKLELAIDPNRAGSGLEHTGETPAEDR